RSRTGPSRPRVSDRRRRRVDSRRCRCAGLEGLTRPLGKLGRATAGAMAGMGYAAMLLLESVYLSLFGWRIGQPLRLRSVFEQMRQIGVDALPIVCLLAFTVGIMLGIQFVSALGEFG